MSYFTYPTVPVPSSAVSTGKENFGEFHKVSLSHTGFRYTGVNSGIMRDVISHGELLEWPCWLPCVAETISLIFIYMLRGGTRVLHCTVQVPYHGD